MWFNLFLFLLTTASLGYLFTRSRGLKPVREWVTEKSMRAEHIDVEPSKGIKNPLYWWLNHFFECWYCNGFYSAIIAWTLLHYEVYFICYWLIGALFALISNSLIKKL